MIASITSLLLFILCYIIGMMLTHVLPNHLSSLQKTLLSPTVGLSLIVIVFYFVNVLGYTINQAAIPITLIFLLISFLVLFKNETKLIIKEKYFYLTLFVSFAFVGYPFVFFGFDWVSYANDDMANYALAAQRSQNFGLEHTPDFVSLLNGGDQSHYFWFMHAVMGHRIGSEILLSYFASLTGLNAHQIFMPTIVMLHMSLVTAIGALACNSNLSKNIIFLSMLFVALSPLTILGTIFQLIAQVGGIAIMLCCLILIVREEHHRDYIDLLKYNILPSLIILAFVVYYTEMLPFFGAVWFLYLLHLLNKDTNVFVGLLKNAFIIFLFSLVILDVELIRYIYFLIHQIFGGLSGPNYDMILFPYYLIPSGIANFWGLSPIAYYLPEPYQNITILLGLINFYLLIKYVIPSIKNSNMILYLLLVSMLAVFLLLFINNSEFGLFKLAMYLQPILFLAIGIYILNNYEKFNKILKLYISLNAAIMISVSFYHTVKVSFKDNSYSEYRVNSQFENLVSSEEFKSCSNTYISDQPNIVLSKFQDLYLKDHKTFFPSRMFYEHLSNIGEESLDNPFMKDNYINSLKNFNDTKNSIIANKYYVYSDGLSSSKKREFVPEAESKNKCFTSSRFKNNTENISNCFSAQRNLKELINSSCFIVTERRNNPFNSYHLSNTGRFYSIKKNVSNKLIFIHSDLGQHYYGGIKNIAYTHDENDPMFLDNKISSLGNNLLFLVVNPSKKPSLVFEASSTLLRQNDNQLPPATVNGKAIDIVGRGSARVLMNNVPLSEIDDLKYLHLNFPKRGKKFPINRIGLMKLYGNDINHDYRNITVFSRDISLVDSSQIASVNIPSSIKNFPSDLKNKNFFYSGIYEDGWISEESYFYFNPSSKSKLLIEGEIPFINNNDFQTKLVLQYEDQIISKELKVGKFQIKIPISIESNKIKIKLLFSNTQRLPNNDNRIVGAYINKIGFVD
ncbi:MAG: hypothetical protein VX096_04015 [Pseudomonadota bacterium]|nr:hypothetical protein [Pseudomonadota bacterium]